MQESPRLESISELISELAVLPEMNPIWFRGQGNAKWKLECSLARDGGIDREIPLIRRFKQNAIQIMQSHPTEEWQWWFIMQHHGLPTRLLDFTESPLVALYFAINEEKHDDSDGCLWTVDPLALNIHSKLDFTYIPGFGDDPHLDDFLPSKIPKLRQPYNPIAVLAPRNNSRILSQQGVFVVFHKDLTPLDESGNSCIKRYIIPKEKKQEFRKSLKALGVHHLSLFPDLDSVASHAKEFRNE